MTQPRLTWEQGKFAGFTGRAGKVRLFTVGYRTVRSDPAYNLRCSLPGFDTKAWKDDDPKVLFAKAERLLETWLAQIGAAVQEPVA